MKVLSLVFLAGAMTVAGFVGSASAQSPTPARIKGGILNGKAVSLPRPEYPTEARAAGIQGTVFVDVEIDEAGAVISAVAATEPRKVFGSKGDEAVEKEVPPADLILRDAAERAAMQAKFSPTKLSGNPVKVTGTIAYNFVVQDSIIGERQSVMNGNAISLPMPLYPPAAMAVRAEGTVVVRIVIDESGDVISATALSGHPLLRAASVEAARNAKFPPRIENGRPVKVEGALTYNFVGPLKENGN